MTPIRLTDLEDSQGCIAFSFLSAGHRGERRTFVYLRDGDGCPVRGLLLMPEHWDGGL